MENSDSEDDEYNAELGGLNVVDHVQPILKLSSVFRISYFDSIKTLFVLFLFF